MESVKRTTLCYLHQDGLWLMLFRNKKPEDPNEGKWIGIGGKIEGGESPDECNAREVYEETGITLRSAHFHGVIRFRSDAWPAEDMYLYSSDDFTWPGAPCSGSFTPADARALPDCSEGELKWIAEEKLLDLPMWEGDRVFLNKLFAGQQDISMTLSYEGEKCTVIEDQE